jgi:hypothetical protein
MRQIVMSGMALIASFAMLGPACGQQVFDSSNGRFNSIMSTLDWPAARSAGFTRGIQEQGAPIVDNAPSPADQIQPVPANAAAPGAADCDGSFQAGSYFNGTACGQACCEPNWFVGVYGLAFERDYEDDIGLSAIPGSLTPYLNTTSAEMGTMGGFETVIGRRDCCGRGFEVGYWGLYPDTADSRIDGSPYTNLRSALQ